MIRLLAGIQFIAKLSKNYPTGRILGHFYAKMRMHFQW